MIEIIEFDECSNYRGSLHAKEEGGKFFWCVDCDVEKTEWNEIPAELWVALKKYHSERESVFSSQGEEA